MPKIRDGQVPVREPSTGDSVSLVGSGSLCSLVDGSNIYTEYASKISLVNPITPAQIGSDALSLSPILAITDIGDYVVCPRYVTSGTRTILVYDKDTLAESTAFSSSSFTFHAQMMFSIYHNGYLYQYHLSNSNGVVTKYDVSNPLSFSVVARYFPDDFDGSWPEFTYNGTRRFARRGNITFTGTGGLVAFDLDTDTVEGVLATTMTSIYDMHLSTDENTLFLITDNAISSIDVSDPTAMTELDHLSAGAINCNGNVNIGAMRKQIAAGSNYLVFSVGTSSSIGLIDISDPSSLVYDTLLVYPSGTVTVFILDCKVINDRILVLTNWGFFVIDGATGTILFEDFYLGSQGSRLETRGSYAYVLSSTKITSYYTGIFY